MMNRVPASLLLIAVSAGAASAADMPPKDMIPGAKDNPLLSRYTGSVIVAYLAKNYDDADLVAGKYKQQEEHVPPFEKILHVEGKITRIVYTYPKERSGLEVFRNYRAAIQSAGMTVLFSCEKTTCDPNPENFGREMENYKINEENETWPKSGDYTEPFNYGRTEPRYILASSTRADGAVTWRRRSTPTAKSRCMDFTSTPIAQNCGRTRNPAWTRSPNCCVKIPSSMCTSSDTPTTRGPSRITSSCRKNAANRSCAASPRTTKSGQTGWQRRRLHRSLRSQPTIPKPVAPGTGGSSW